MTNGHQVEATFKVVLAGDAGTGKTSLVTRLTKQAFGPASTNSDLIHLNTYEFIIKDNNIVTACIWDLAGGQKYRSMTQSAYHDASGVFLVYDISNAATFESIPDWLKLVRSACDPKQMMLVGNKTDLTKSRAVSTEEAQTFANENGLLFTETSAFNDDHVESAFVQMVIALSNNDRQERPFQVVLIDRKSAAKGQIHCVERPLQGDLKFVALSYRWGELSEKLVDTKLGYIATITSFRLEDFYHLCQMMEYDPDLKQMDYVWVDAICVDQSNYERRKATIYHMSEIYKHANYILAVPDLHLQYLWDASSNTQKIITNNLNHVEYLYYLFHGNFERLYELDDLFLDDIGFPENPNMRRWLITHTEYLTTGFTEYELHDKTYNPISALEHICETILEICQSSSSTTADCIFNPFDARKLGMDRVTHYCSRTECPLDLYCLIQGIGWQKVRQPNNVSGKESWAYVWSRMILDRSTQIRQGVKHFMDLMKDWSTRAWVISEFKIAKEKNNLKYWFIQFPANETLSSEFNTTVKSKSYLNYSSIPVAENKTCSSRRPIMSVKRFYKFNFRRHRVRYRLKTFNPAHLRPYGHFSNPVFEEFHSLMIKQLRNQTFLEMMLKSKASRNEDRFYAVIPSSQYKYILENRDVVSSWKIQSMVSVKLKLYQLMHDEDKLMLFFLSAHWNSLDSHPIPPTFATSTIYWQDSHVKFPPIFDTKKSNFNVSFSFPWLGNEDLNSAFYTGSIRLVPPSNSSSKYCLNVKPKIYYMLTAAAKNDYFDQEYPEYKTVCERLQIDSNSNAMDIVFMYPRTDRRTSDHWFYNGVFLIGNMASNKWEIHKYSLGESSVPDIPTKWKRYSTRLFGPYFNIY